MSLEDLDVPAEVVWNAEREMVDHRSSEAAQEVAKLVEATWAIAARTGRIEAPVREILGEAGLGTRAFYRHFQSSDDLLTHALEAGTTLLVEALERRTHATSDPVARINGFVTGFARAAAPSSARRQLPWCFGVSRLATRFPVEVDKCQSRIVEVLRALIADAVLAGRAVSEDPARDAWVIFGCSLDLVLRQLSPHPGRADVEHLVDFVHRALAISPA